MMLSVSILCGHNDKIVIECGVDGVMRMAGKHKIPRENLL
jgi:hypothetical protein